jgi:two-component system sensor histidine kinase KdpD
MLKVRVAAAAGGRLHYRKAGYPPEDVLDEADGGSHLGVAEQSAAGRGSQTPARSKTPVSSHATGRGAIGIMGIDSDKPGPLLTSDERRLLDALIDQSTLAIERVRSGGGSERAKRTLRRIACAPRF